MDMYYAMLRKIIIFLQKLVRRVLLQRGGKRDNRKGWKQEDAG
jgi:hypothetical protein